MSTVRDFLVRRTKQAWLLRLAVIGGLAVLAALLKGAVDSGTVERYVAVLSLLALVSVLMPLGAYLARCPKCHYPFEFMGRVRLRMGAKKYRTNFCPHCGLNLEAPAATRTSGPVAPSDGL